MRKRPLLSKRNAIPLRFFLSYFVIACIAIVSTWGSYSQVQQVLTSNAQNFSLKTMASIRDLVDERLLKMDAAINRIASYSQTNLILNLDDPIGQGRMYALKEYIDYLRNAAVQLSPEAYLTVYSRANGYVFEADFACLYPSFYKEAIRGGEDVTQSPWLTMMETAQPATLKPAQVVYRAGVAMNVVPYVQSLPLGSKKNTGSICLYVDVQSLFSGLIDLTDSTLSYVSDAHGNVIASFSNEDVLPSSMPPIPKDDGVINRKMDGREMMICYVSSARGLSYVSMTPRDIIMRQANHVRNLFLLTTLVCFALCLVAAAVFVRKNASPVSKVYHMLLAHMGETGEKAANLKYIEHAVSQILRDNSHLLDTLGRQTEEMRMAYFSHLLTSGFESEKEMLAAANYMGVDPEGGLYVVVASRILYPGDYAEKETIAKLHAIKATIRQAVFPCQSSITVVDTSANQLALVFSLGKDATDYYRVFVDYLMLDLKNLLDDLQIAFKSAASAPRMVLGDIYQAHQEAVLTLDFIDAGAEAPVTWYEEEKRHGQILYYPLEVEQRFIACLRGGNTQELSALFDKVIHENTQKLHISGPMGSLLIAEMQATLLRFFEQYDGSNGEMRAQGVQRLMAQRGLSFFDAAMRLKEQYLDMCERTAHAQASYGEELKQRILAYADKNATDPNMSLSMAAEHFGFSQSYFSSVFKKQTGENFVSYIAQKRLAAACQWLAKEHYTVEEIAQMTGYTSAHSFRRAFKKQYGVNPTSTRQR